MTQLHLLTQFNELFDNIKKLLNIYNYNLRNELFEKEPNETNEQAYRRGETIFDRCYDDLENLTTIIEQESNIVEFFEICKQNKSKLIDKKNEIINKLLRIKKNDVSREEYLNLRDFWNNYREETPDVKNRRECEEMLEEMKEREQNIERIKQDIVNEKTDLLNVKKDLEEKINQAKKEKNEFNIREEFNKVMNDFVKKNDFDQQNQFMETKCQQFNETMNEVKEQQNTIYIDQLKLQDKVEKNETLMKEEFNNVTNNFVKKSDIPQTLKETKNIININHFKQLEEWSGLKCGDILFDSNVDNWNVNTSILNDKIIGKKQLIFIVEHSDNEIFGYYFNTQIIEKYNERMETDNKSFQFNLQSKNNRLQSSMQFEINDLQNGGIQLYERNNNILISLGNIHLHKENDNNNSTCQQNENYFNYHEIPNALCGQLWENKYFTTKRILVIQMKTREKDETKELLSKIQDLELTMKNNSDETQQLSTKIQQLQNQNKQIDDRQRQMNFEMMKQNMSNNWKQIEEWTKLKFGEILFDSDVDNWSEKSSVFNVRIIGKTRLTFLIEDEDGEIYGYYFNTQIIENYGNCIETDNQTFHFNLRSQNNRLNQPMKFEIKDSKNGGIILYGKSNQHLISLGDIHLNKLNKKNQSYCVQNYVEEYNNIYNYNYNFNQIYVNQNDKFFYSNIRNVLCGKYNFIPKRILVIQME